MATYRFRDVFPGWDGAGGPRRAADRIVEAVRGTCSANGWRLACWDVRPDRVELLLLGEEPQGERGETVAAALDAGVHGAAGALAAVN
ncbi:MAG: hypothetical protein FJ098_11210 [Deltaproteobacteria bacterium]|nr:hypothetical protein [Deltaproteobacteria bacterium]